MLALDEAHVRVLAATRAARRRGVGQLLMNHCADVARQHGKARLTLNTSFKNSVAQGFYESIGYTRLPDIELGNDSKLCSYELRLWRFRLAARVGNRGWPQCANHQFLVVDVMRLASA
jgi:Acetyltransferase (GNAT) family